MKPIRLTTHARLQCQERGATEAEVVKAVREGAREPAKNDRERYRYNFAYHQLWQGTFYGIKQVVKEEEREIVVITVYTFYF